MKFFAGVNDCKKVAKEHRPKWDLKLVDDCYSEAPQVDDFDLSLEDELVGDSATKPTGQQDELVRVLL